MDEYKQHCDNVTRGSIALIVPWLNRLGWTLKPYIDKNDQLTKGDYLGTHTDGRCKNFEMKAEQKHTGNLFLEEWSNRDFNPLYRKLGWMFNLTHCDYLVYHFLDTGDVYILDLKKLKTFNYSNHCGRWVEIDAPQANRTCGFVVSVELLKTVGCIFRHTKLL